MLRGNYFRNVLIGAALLAASFLYYRFPADRHAFPGCWLRERSGLYCPGCGGQRSFSALLHGHIAEAFACNALFVTLLPIALLFTGWRLLIRPAPLSLRAQTIIALAVCSAVVLFGILRNLPAFHLLAL